MPAPPMPFLPREHPRQAHRAGACSSTPARSRLASGPWRRSGRSPRRSPTWSGRCATRRSTRPRRSGYHPAAVGRTMFLDTIDRDEAETIVDYLQASDAPMRVAQLRVLGGAMARVPAEATAFAHRASRIMVNVAAFYDGPEDRAVRTRPGWPTSPRRSARATPAPTSTSWATRARSGSARPTPGDLGPARDDQGPLRPGQPVPAQPEHPAGLIRVGASAPRRLSSAGTGARAVRCGCGRVGGLRHPDRHPLCDGTPWCLRAPTPLGAPAHMGRRVTNSPGSRRPAAGYELPRISIRSGFRSTCLVAGIGVGAMTGESAC